MKAPKDSNINWIMRIWTVAFISIALILLICASVYKATTFAMTQSRGLTRKMANKRIKSLSSSS